MQGALDHLGREVVECPAHRPAAAVGRVHRPPEVRDLDVALGVQQQVLGLNVPVDDLASTEHGK